MAVQGGQSSFSPFVCWGLACHVCVDSGMDCMQSDKDKKQKDNSRSVLTKPYPCCGVALCAATCCGCHQVLLCLLCSWSSRQKRLSVLHACGGHLFLGAMDAGQHALLLAFTIGS